MLYKNLFLKLYLFESVKKTLIVTIQVKATEQCIFVALSVYYAVESGGFGDEIVKVHLTPKFFFS